MSVILLREIQEKDLDALERFAQIPGMFNLPSDRDLLREKIIKSTQSFSDQLTNKFDAKYVFVAEDTQTGKVLGTSMIAAQHGTADAPHFYFEVGSERKFSETINTGFIHGTLKLRYDTNGPSELGGLVIDPEHRNHESRVGRQISFARFLFVAMNRSRFKRKLIAELLPPLNKKGQSPLWEAIGRRFTNMDYWEADQLCAKNKEFIFSLFPTGKIYTTFLPADARNAIGKVGKDTEPVLHMLKKIGFTYKNQVDPFDAGPHLWANVDDVHPIKKATHGALAFADKAVDQSRLEAGLLSASQPAQPGTFRAVSVLGRVESGVVQVAGVNPEEALSLLGVRAGAAVSFMPFY